jgi:predicted ArsR family transcriptional regulator
MKPSDQRILALLDQPRTRKELMRKTGYSRNYIHEAMARLAPHVEASRIRGEIGRPAFLYQARERVGVTCHE